MHSYEKRDGLTGWINIYSMGTVKIATVLNLKTVLISWAACLGVLVGKKCVAHQRDTFTSWQLQFVSNGADVISGGEVISIPHSNKAVVIASTTGRFLDTRYLSNIYVSNVYRLTLYYRLNTRSGIMANSWLKKIKH